MRSLFDPRQGIGVSFLRQPIGSSDFTAAAEHYTYDDVPAGQTDFALTHFSIAHDQAQILPLLRRAKQLNPAAEGDGDAVEPAGLDEDRRLPGRRPAQGRPGGLRRLRALPGEVRAGVHRGRRADRLPLDPERAAEPHAERATRAPTCRSARRPRSSSALGPLLRTASPRTKILGYDHNWTTHPDDVASTPPGEDPETDYPYKLLQSPAAKWIAGTAYHCYSGDPSRADRAARRRSRRRASGSPSAPARTGRTTPRRRSSAAPSPGTPAT